MTDFDAFFEIFIYVLNTQQRKQCKKRKLGQNLKLLFLKYQEKTGPAERQVWRKKDLCYRKTAHSFTILNVVAFQTCLVFGGISHCRVIQSVVQFFNPH